MRENRRKKRQKKRNRSGTTLVEMIVCLMLISILMAMAAQTLSSASRIFVEVQKTQYAQSILDTAMTELRSITKDATVYVKLYRLTATGGNDLSDKIGETEKGQILEFVNEEGYAVVVSAEGCTETTLTGGSGGTAEAVEKGRLLTRYYTRNADGTYLYKDKSSRLLARAVAPAFGNGFYMGNYLGIEFSVPGGTQNGDPVTEMTAVVTLYRDRNRTKVIAQDTEILDFRHDVVLKEGQSGVTAKKES